MNKIINTSKTFFLKDRPLFGFDIGHDMLRVIQFDMGETTPRLKGYGSIAFDPAAIVDGVIEKPELIAKAAVKLFQKKLIGDISTKHVAVSIPASRAFINTIQLPVVSAKGLDGAIQIEAEQHLPTSIDNVYWDYMIMRQDSKVIEVFFVAVPKKIVDSYLVLTRMLGLEAVIFNTSIMSSAQLFTLDKRSDLPSVLIDFASMNTDISIYNHGLVVTGTTTFGGDKVTEIISKALRISTEEAVIVKSKYGLSVSEVQKKIITALEPSLELLLKEIRRIVRYYEQRYEKEAPISQIITIDGGANMPGLAEYLTEQLRMPVRPFDLVTHIEFGHLHTFYNADAMSYALAAGLAITNPADIFV